MEELSSQTKIRGYINGEMDNRSERMKSMRGTNIVKIRNSGFVTLSTMSLEKAQTDPIPGKLLVNLINDLLNE